MLTLGLSSLAFLGTLYNLYKTFWQTPSPVISIKSRFLGFMEVEGGHQVNFLFLEGVLLNSSKAPLVLHNVDLQVIYEDKWVTLPKIYVDENENIPLGDRLYQFGPNADKFDLLRLNSIITLEKPQFFYVKFNIPERVMSKMTEQSINLHFIIKDGFGKEFNYMVSSEIDGGVDLSKLPKLYLKEIDSVNS